MSYNTDHLSALNTRLSNETARHGDNPAMSGYLQSIRNEIAQEENFLISKGVETYDGADISDDELDQLLSEYDV